jgi:hypothetical protein
MKHFKFATVSGGDWTEHMVGREEGEDTPLTDIDTGEIQVQVQDNEGGLVLNLSTADATITRPAAGEYQWVVAADTISGWCPGKTFHVASRHINEAGGITILWTGSLAYIVGGYKWR